MAGQHKRSNSKVKISKEIRAEDVKIDLTISSDDNDSDGEGKYPKNDRGRQTSENEKSSQDFESNGAENVLSRNSDIPIGSTDSSCSGLRKTNIENKGNKNSTDKTIWKSALDADFNDTDDFSGGITPYRAAVFKNVLRQEKLRKGNRLTKRRKKLDQADESIITSEKSIVNNPMSTHSSDESKEKRDHVEAGPVHGNPKNVKKCITCSEFVDIDDFEAHRSQCLILKFQRNKNVSEEDSKRVGLHYCQICQADITSMQADERSSHVNACIDKSGQKETIIDDSGTNTCQICKKDLRRYNSQRKMQHINRCADELEDKEKQQRKQQEALEKAKNKVLDCPLCGQHLKTLSGRKKHMKRCAITYGVSVGALQERIKQQQEEYARKLEAGVLPPQPQVKKRKNLKSTRTTSTVIRPEEPMSKADADLQLAVALSESIRQENTENSDVTRESQASNVFSVLMTPKVHKHTKRKTKTKPTPALLLADQMSVTARLEGRVANMITAPDCDEVSSTPQFPRSSITTTRPYSLWESAVGENCGRGRFYVKSLMPPVVESTVATGSKIRRLTSIPGRGNTSFTEESPSKEEKVDLNNTTMIATTQTALVLAEMDEDVSVMNISKSEADLNATGFIYPEDDKIEKKRKFESSCERFLNQQEKMINNKTLNDLLLETAGGTVFAHKYPIALKCPSLLKHIQQVSRIDLQTFSKSSVIALLRYLYIDDCSPADEVVEELSTLAEKFGMRELSQICSDNLEKMEEIGEGTFSENSTPDLNTLIKKVWGSDVDSDSSSEDETSDKIKAVEEREDVEIDAVYEYMSTQKSRAQIQDDGKSEQDVTDTDEDSNMDDKVCRKRMLRNSQSTFLSEDILKELLTPNKDSAKHPEHYLEHINKREEIEEREEIKSVETENLDLQLMTSDADDISDDDIFVGSPLVEKIRKSMEAKHHAERKMENKYAQKVVNRNEAEFLKYLPDPKENKSIILLCEKCSQSEEDLRKYIENGFSGNFSMTRKDLRTARECYQEFHSCTITVCSKCTPCREANSSNIKNKEKSVITKIASRTLDFSTSNRKCLYETPVMSRTWSATTSVTPDLFDTSTATEEYSMNLSQLSLNDGRTRKISSSTSKVLNDVVELVEDDKEKDNKNTDGSQTGNTSAHIDNCQESYHEGKGEHDKRDFNYSDDSAEKQEDFSFNDDDVIALSQAEVAKLPKSRSPSPVFGSQVAENDVVKKEKLDLDDDGDDGDQSKEDVATAGSDWLKRDYSKSADKPKKVYSFKSKKRNKIDALCSTEKEKSPVRPELESNVKKRRSRSLSLSQKRKKRRSSDDSPVSSQSNKRSRAADDDELIENKVSVTAESNEHIPSEPTSLNNSSQQNDEDAIDLTQEESPEHKDIQDNPQESPGEFYNEVDEIPWDDDIDDGVLVMDEPEQLYHNHSGVGSPKSPSTEEAVVQNKPDTSLVYDPPTDVETDYSLVCNNSGLWNDENKPNVPGPSQDMLKTPTAPAPKSRKKPLSEWVPLSPYTPMPAYDAMDTPELKRQCKKYGIRPLPKKRMQTTLKTIHAETHAYETDSDFEQPLNKSTEGGTVRAMIKTSKNLNKSKGKTSKEKKQMEVEKKISQKAINSGSSESDGIDDLDSSQDSVPDMLEESIMPDFTEDDEDDFTPTQINASPKSKEQRAKEKKMKKIDDMKRYFRSNIVIWEKVLHYSVFEFDDLKEELTNAGIKVGNEVLTDFLDEMNIQFSLRNHQGGRQRKKGKGSPKKNGSPKKKGRGRPKAIRELS